MRVEGTVERQMFRQRDTSLFYFTSFFSGVHANYLSPEAIDHLTVSCLVAWPLNESEAGGDLVLIETSLLFSC